MSIKIELFAPAEVQEIFKEVDWIKAVFADRSVLKVGKAGEDVLAMLDPATLEPPLWQGCMAIEAIVDTDLLKQILRKAERARRNGRPVKEVRV